MSAFILRFFGAFVERAIPRRGVQSIGLTRARRTGGFAMALACEAV